MGTVKKTESVKQQLAWKPQKNLNGISCRTG
jgi:hypothetical protein